MDFFIFITFDEFVDQKKVSNKRILTCFVMNAENEGLYNRYKESDYIRE